MKYNEVIDALETVASALPIDSYHYTEDHVNEYMGDFPVAVISPPVASISYNNSNAVASTSTYSITIAFMDLISPESSRAEKQNVVEVQHLNAASFAITMVEGWNIVPEIQFSKVSDIVISPFFTFTWNAHLTAGAMLEFKWETRPTWDCAQVPATKMIKPIIQYFASTTFVNITFASGIEIATALGDLYSPSNEIFYQVRKNSTWEDFDTTTFGTSNAPVSSLDPGKYYFRARYEDSTGRLSQWSDVIDVTLTA